MTRKLSVLLVLAFFVMSLGSLALAAKAKTAGQNTPYTSDASARKILTSDNDVSAAPTSGKPAISQPTAMGYYMLGQVQVGTSEFDWQSNDRQQRQVVMGSDNKIHTVWINRDYGLDPAGPRSVNYSGWTAGGGLPPTPSSPISTVGYNGGYGSIAVGPGDDRAIATFHHTPTGTGFDTRPRLAIGKQLGALGTTFLMFDYPTSDPLMPLIFNCQGIKTSGVAVDTTDGSYIWPSIAADNNGTATIVHVLAKETPVQDTSGKASLVYWQSLPNAAFPGAFTCGTLIDSVASSINYDIAASPVSNKVAAVYNHPKSWTGYDLGDNDDVVYKESNNLGATWGAMVNVTNFRDTQDLIPGSGNGDYRLRANEVSALYTDDDCLHILYSAYWTSDQHYYLIYPDRIFHWSSCTPTCNVMLIDANGTWGPAAGRPPLGQQLVAKISLTQCTVGPNKRLYAVYTMYPDSTGLAGNTYSDRSTTPVLNGECVVQGSMDNTGALWGPVVNVSQTRSDGCTSVAMNCFSEQFTNAAPYVSDSLRIQYMVDKDAGSAIQSAAGGTSNPQGVLSDNPIVIKSYPCYSVTPVAILAATPDSILWPFHTTPGAGVNHTKAVTVTLLNTGNTAAIYTRTVNYTNGSGWLTFSQPASSSVPAGCVQTLAEVVTATGPATEGLYKAVVTWSYTGGKTLTLPVELYNFTNWYMEENNSIRTSTMRMGVNQTSRTAAQKAGFGFKYFSDGADTGYLYDGSLLIGTSNTTLSMGVFSDSAGAGSHGDALIGRLFALTNTGFDSTGTPGVNTVWPNNGYRHSWGSGCNKDSTIAFDADFYAPKHIDSANFMVGKFSLYAGPKAPTATTTNVTVGYACDWDVPDDSAENIGGADPGLQMVYQSGTWGTNTGRFAALSGWRGDGVPAVGGQVMANVKTIYRLRGYVHDSIWTKIQGTTTFTYNQMNYGTETFDTTADLNSMLVFSKTATIKPKASGVFTVFVIFAGQPRGGSIEGLNAAVNRGRAFITNYLACTACGDANSDGAVDISDVVFLISHIFSGGQPPQRCNYAKGKGDANGDGTLDISDAVYLISRIFSGGQPPKCYQLAK